jgi:hypothetical protein
MCHICHILGVYVFTKKNTIFTAFLHCNITHNHQVQTFDLSNTKLHQSLGRKLRIPEWQNVTWLLHQPHFLASLQILPDPIARSRLDLAKSWQDAHLSSYPVNSIDLFMNQVGFTFVYENVNVFRMGLSLFIVFFKKKVVNLGHLALLYCGRTQ